MTPEEREMLSEMLPGKAVLVMPPEMLERLKEFANETANWCPLCDCHPSSGHDEACPLHEKDTPHCERCGDPTDSPSLYVAEHLRASVRAAGGSAQAFLGGKDNPGWVHLCPDCREAGDEEFQL